MTSKDATDSGGESSDNLGSSLSLDPNNKQGYTQLVPQGSTEYMASPNGLYTVDSVDPPTFNNSTSLDPNLASGKVAPTIHVSGPNGKSETVKLQPVGSKGHIDIGNDGTVTEYASAGTGDPIQTNPASGLKPVAGECVIVNSSNAPEAVQHAIKDAQGLTQQMLGQFGSKKPQVVEPYPLTTSNTYTFDKTLETTKGKTSDEYNKALKSLTTQEKEWEGKDAAAIEASAKMVDANNKYYNAIIHTIADLNVHLRALLPPGSKKYDAANTDSILVSVATAMETVQKNYKSYLTEVADAAKNIPIKYTVKSGDNLSNIAAAHGTTWQKVYKSNSKAVGDDPNLILPGQVLTIQPGDGAKTSGSSTSDSKTSGNTTSGNKTTNTGLKVDPATASKLAATHLDAAATPNPKVTTTPIPKLTATHLDDAATPNPKVTATPTATPTWDGTD